MLPLRPGQWLAVIVLVVCVKMLLGFLLPPDILVGLKAGE